MLIDEKANLHYSGSRFKKILLVPVMMTLTMIIILDVAVTKKSMKVIGNND